jgi:hypothetical protein
MSDTIKKRERETGTDIPYILTVSQNTIKNSVENKLQEVSNIKKK